MRNTQTQPPGVGGTAQVYIEQYTPLKGVGVAARSDSPPPPPTECTTSTKLGQKPASLPNRRFACVLHPFRQQQRPLDESAPTGAAILTVGKRRGTLFWATPIFLAMTTCESRANVTCHLPSVSSVC